MLSMLHLFQLYKEFSQLQQTTMDLCSAIHISNKNSHSSLDVALSQEGATPERERSDHWLAQETYERKIAGSQRDCYGCTIPGRLYFWFLGQYTYIISNCDWCCAGAVTAVPTAAI